MIDKPIDSPDQPGDGIDEQTDAREPRRADLQAEQRRLRSAGKLRENLQRRKQQVRARRAGQADETDGLPAAKMDES